MAFSVGSQMDSEELRAAALAEHKKRVIRMADELDHMIKLVAHCRESVQEQVFSGFGYKKMGMNEKELKAVKELALTWNSVVDAKIRFDKAQKGLAEAMTPDEEKAAVVAFIKSLDATERANMLRGIRQWMRNAGEDVSGFTAGKDGSGDRPEPGI